MTAESSSSTSLRIQVESNPPETRLSELNFKCWPKYTLTFYLFMGLSTGKYRLKYDAEETFYVVRGKVKAYYYPMGSSSSLTNQCVVEFGAGDLVTIPKGLSCTWDVSLSVDKFYKFES